MLVVVDVFPRNRCDLSPDISAVNARPSPRQKRARPVKSVWGPRQIDWSQLLFGGHDDRTGTGQRGGGSTVVVVVRPSFVVVDVLIARKAGHNSRILSIPKPSSSGIYIYILRDREQAIGDQLSPINHLFVLSPGFSF